MNRHVHLPFVFLSLSVFMRLYSGTTINLGPCGDKCECGCVHSWLCVHVLLCDAKRKVMEHHGPYSNKESAMGGPGSLQSQRHYQRERERETESKRDCQRHRCLPTNLPSRLRVVKLWWLKANVRSYEELSSAIREDYCHCLDSEKDRVKGKRSGAMAMAREIPTESIQKKKGLVDEDLRAKDILNVERWQAEDRST